MEKTFFSRKKVFLVLAGCLWASMPTLAAGPSVGPVTLPDRLQVAVQQLTVRGTVTDQSGSPLPGVSVVERTTTNGVATDFDGKSEIRPNKPQRVLVYSYLG